MPKTSRRDFLRWTLAGSGLLLAGAASVLEPAPARAVTRLGAPTQQTALFMGTMVSITVACPSSTQAHDAMDLAFAEGRRLEALLTRHDAAAPLGVLNSQGSLRDVPPELLNVWQRAHGICHLTGGAFDATVLPLVRLLESRSNPEGELELPESDLREALALVDTEAVYAGRDGMRLERQGMGLTLGRRRHPGARSQGPGRVLARGRGRSGKARPLPAGAGAVQPGHRHVRRL